MKFKECPAYNADTETIQVEIGSANGQILYSEKNIILSEKCSLKNLIDDFDCSDCQLLKINKNKN